ncbi:guanine deaminase [Rhodococcus sp. WS1]|uniref:amidohydrolase family protein n=1 Tax=Rhodococcus TaxID=1827 RepID=UPI00038DCDC8|nr:MULTISPECIES: amidohydrolase family protein [Rhodococcus]AGT93760.1 guanine deaminase [Rhodococcus erythropolis CCM2595]MBO8149475.1 amidohydrolase family protein [Rhodococcus erythropolis]MDO1491626.1 amidohydrolase family protein [Rhodococcus erythropolis]OFV77260.1 guanine deaminase [Rhodococcus erythropolis]ROZ56828.1 guanine deaminase [Rhodococcus sp. WS1]
MTHLHRGHVFHISGRPTVEDAAQSLVSIPDGVLAIDDAGTIVYCGEFESLPGDLAGGETHDHRPGFLLPGFVDAHIHFPQTYAGDAYGGGQLLEWLDLCVFPSESRFADPEFAQHAAEAFCARRIATGTTAAMVFGSAFPHAQDALFSETLNRGLRVVSGRGIQTTGPASAAALITSEEDAIRLTREEIDKWHAADTGDVNTALIHVAVVPRFSLAVTTRTLKDLGELYDSVRDRGVYFHSHLNENNRPGTGEVATTLAEYEVETYLDTYDGKFLPGSQVGGKSFLGPRAILAHSVHCQDSELARMAETGTSIAHCPTSQQFLGSGTMPWKRTVASGVNIAIGSDFGGGDECLLTRVLGDAFKVHISEAGDDGVSMHPAELLFTGTLAGARALDMENRIGNFDEGKEADFLVIDPSGWPPLAGLVNHGTRSDDPILARDQTLFGLLMAMREPAIAHVYVQGRRVSG